MTKEIDEQDVTLAAGGEVAFELNKYDGASIHYLIDELDGNLSDYNVEARIYQSSAFQTQIGSSIVMEAGVDGDAQVSRSHPVPRGFVELVVVNNDGGNAGSVDVAAQLSYSSNAGKFTKTRSLAGSQEVTNQGTSSDQDVNPTSNGTNTANCDIEIQHDGGNSGSIFVGSGGAAEGLELKPGQSKVWKNHTSADGDLTVRVPSSASGPLDWSADFYEIS